MRIAVIGAGAMGRGIAQVSTAGGHDVVLHDANTAALAGARDGIAAQDEVSDPGRVGKVILAVDTQSEEQE